MLCALLVVVSFTPLPRLSPAPAGVHQLQCRTVPPRLVLGKLFGKATDKSADAAVGVQMQAAEAAPASLIETADELHASKQVSELFALLKSADASDDELAWRIARAHHDMAEESVDDPARREQLLRDGLAIAEASKSRCGSGPALKWYGIILGRMGDFLPTKEKVANSFKVKEALEGAAAEIPEDPTVQTALGQWCFKVAGISWIERKVAKALFGSPPESSYDEALGFFEQSDAIRPSKKASYFAGQSCLKLKRTEEGKAWLAKCLELPSSGEADAELDAQAKAELK